MESFHQNYGVNNFENGVAFLFELDTENGEETEPPVQEMFIEDKGSV